MDCKAVLKGAHYIDRCEFRDFGSGVAEVHVVRDVTQCRFIKLPTFRSIVVPSYSWVRILVIVMVKAL
jgi:hypothetical protein